ncbi:hypothetical protein EV189_3463 [Motilibacter rhizosphaerae]|uniref:Uncharacterized protein n=1 Tax=Motilibacter rhizosphaerae TaxID=598652 RepID=A0A4V2F2T2_9ACTN|nr:hypothetical protein [Motilibacter rhizosphaerae]RZS79984.1 hypothetical protein EV189_3463 [Motilibacter rhizosphaerae]
MRLELGTVLAVDEEVCRLVDGGRIRDVPWAAAFPRPRAERVAPGNLVATAGGRVVWRWYDAVVTGAEGGFVELWEPGHGRVLARPRAVPAVGTRAYLSAGLPGAEWWVAGPVVPSAQDADVELAEVERFVVVHGIVEVG